MVDDEPSVLLTLVANLELEGFEVAEAAGGAPALDLVRARTFDVVVTDVRMPGVDGLELLRRIRPLRHDLPVILITAFAGESILSDALGTGAFTVLPKPCKIDRVVAAIRRAARRPAVLVIGDAREETEQTAAFLRRASLSARTAYGRDALVSLARGDVDVCIADLAARGADGGEIVARIREKHPAVAVIATSNGGASDAVARAAAGGALACLRKPFSPAELIRLVAEARGGSAAQEAA